MWPSVAPEALAAAGYGVEHTGLLTAGLLLVAALAFSGLLLGPTRVRVPTTPERRLADWTWLLSLGLRVASLALVVLAAAGPLARVAERPGGGQGIDLLIALDASGSMEALDATLEGRRVTRLELARAAIADLVRQRRDDRIGLVVFGDRAFTRAPLSVDHRLLLGALEHIEPRIAGDATALGEAIGLAVRRLQAGAGPHDAGRVLLVITDGRHNAGRLGPETAAHIARQHGIRIHTAGIGTTGSAPFAPQQPGEPLRFEKVELDRQTLERIAEIGGGKFFHAEQPQDLRGIARWMDELEPVRQPLPAPTRAIPLAPQALALALALLLLDALTAHGLLRRLP